MTAMRRVALLSAALVALSGGIVRAQEKKELRVLASFLPMAVFTRNVVGDAPGVRVEMMLPASLGCPHDYDLTPGDMKKIAAADLFIVNGMGLEEFLGRPVQKANPRVRVVDTSAEVKPLRAGKKEDHAAHGAGHGHTHGHDHGEFNPHTWVSPRNAIAQVRAIEKALCDALPAQADTFKRNADAYAARLEQLVAEFEKASAGFVNKRIATYHNVFGYLARDFGLEVVGEIESTPDAEPSAREMRALVTTLRDSKAAVVFAEPQYSTRLAETIAQEAGVPLRVLDPVATGAESLTVYEDVMRANLRVLIEVLGRP